MGADMMLYTLPDAEITPARKARLLEIVDRLTHDDVRDWLDNGCSKSKKHLQQELRVAIDELETVRDSREVCVLRCPGMKYHLLTTGGTSWGDAPTELTATFRLIACCEPLDRQLQAWAEKDCHVLTSAHSRKEKAPKKPAIFCVDVPDPASLKTDYERWVNVGRFNTRAKAVEFIRDHIAPCDDQGRVMLITTVERMGAG